MKIYSNPLLSYAPTVKRESTAESGSDFQSILNQKKEVSFSKHATMRLDSRKINFSDEQLRRVEDGVNKAESKGIKDSLVVVDNVSLVVNVRNRIVVTAVDNNEANVFTNIDGAVIV